MAATTLEAFVDAILDEEYTGVKKVLKAPPGSVTTAIMPAMWIHSARSSEIPIAKSSISWPLHSADVWVIVSPVAQAKDGMREAIQLADVLRPAFRSAALAIGQASVNIETQQLGLNEKSYWGLIVKVEAQG